MDTAFGTIWEGVAAALPDAVAIRTPDGATSYAEFEARAARLASAFLAAGVEPGSTVANYLYNGPEYLESVFAAMKLGAIPVNVNYRYRDQELAELLADAGAGVLVFAASLAEHVRLAAARVPSLRLLVPVGGEPTGYPVRAIGYDEIQRTNTPLPAAPRPGSDQLFMYTGGTTGKPKGVVWQQSALLPAISVATYTALGKTPPDTPEAAVDTAVAVHAEGIDPVTMPTVPLMHATGLFNTMGTLLVGGEVVFPGGTSLDPARVWAAVRAHRVTNLLVAGNAVARPLVDELRAAERRGAPHDLTSLRRIISSGAVFSDDLKAALHERSAATIYDALAASEGGPFAFAVTTGTQDLPSRFRLAAGAVVLDEHERPVEPGSGTVGVLAFQGALPAGYHNAPDRTASTFRPVNGTRHVVVGDHATVEADGTVRFLGRGASVINTGGEKVYTAEVEGILLGHPAVADVVVLGEPDPTWGERVAAVIAPQPDASLDTAEIIDWLRPRLAAYKIPRRVVFVPRLPRTPTGKMELGRARELLHTKDESG